MQLTTQSRQHKLKAKFYIGQSFLPEQNLQIQEQWMALFAVFITVRRASKDMQIG